MPKRRNNILLIELDWCCKSWYNGKNIEWRICIPLVSNNIADSFFPLSLIRTPSSGSRYHPPAREDYNTKQLTALDASPHVAGNDLNQQSLPPKTILRYPVNEYHQLTARNASPHIAQKPKSVVISLVWVLAGSDEIGALDGLPKRGDGCQEGIIGKADDPPTGACSEGAKDAITLTDRKGNVHLRKQRFI